MGPEEIFISIAIAASFFLIIKYVVRPLLVPSQDEYSEQLQEAIDATPVSSQTVSPGMSEAKFWELIEKCWDGLDPKNIRQDWADGKASEKTAEIMEISSVLMCRNLQASLQLLSSQDLERFDAILDRKLYDLDSEALAEIVEGGDDGFLDARGFIVSLGKNFYEYVLTSKNPRLVPGLGNEEFSYLASQVFEEQHGSTPDWDTGISRETGSNAAMWND